MKLCLFKFEKLDACTRPLFANPVTIIRDSIVRHVSSNTLLANKQHGFLSKRSCITQLLIAAEYSKKFSRGPPLAIFIDVIWNHAESWLNSLIPDSILCWFLLPKKDLRYHVMRFYRHAQKFTSIIVKILIPDTRITLIPLVIPLDS